MYRTSSSISALITLLQTQQARFEVFLTLLTREREAIKSLATAPLVEISQAKLTLLGEIRSLEDERATVVCRIASQWGVTPDSLTLRGIAQRLASEESVTMLRLQERLHRIVAAVREATTFNGELLARSLAFVKQGLDVWRSAPRATSLYSSQGALKPGVHQGELVRQRG